MIQSSIVSRVSAGLAVSSFLPALLHAQEMTAVQEEYRLPNVVLINIDDMGYADPACYGLAYAPTPNMDRLASEGVRFTDFYVSQAVSSASRASLLTGCYSNRVSILGAANPYAKTGISKEETTIAEMLKQKGYATAVFGKWHLGHLEKFLPPNHGFDEYCGVPYSNDMIPDFANNKNYPPLPLIEGTKVVDTVSLEDQSGLTKLYTKRSLNFIRNHRDQPFFLYLAHTMVHIPLAVSDEFKGRSGKSLYQDVLLELDWSLGEIMKTLEESGLTEKTLIIFTSDNGPWLCCGIDGGRADPLREGKGTAWEGGVRVPCIMKWPGVIPAGTICKESCMTIDILPALASITGLKLPERKIDGLDIFPLMRDPEHARSPHHALFFYYGKKLNALRWGGYKLHLPHSYTSLSGRPRGTGWEKAKYDILNTDTALYDLGKDIAEQYDIKMQHPEVVRKMALMADSIKALLGDEGITGSEVRLPGYADGFVAGPGKIDHIGIGRKIVLESPASPKYPGTGPGTLLDGLTGPQLFDTKFWLGFEGNDLEALIDFDSLVTFSEVSVNALQETVSWIFYPESITVSVSPDNKTFAPRGYSIRRKPLPDGTKNFIMRFAPVKARYLKVLVKNTGICPEGHPGEGHPAWLFVCEIIVR